MTTDPLVEALAWTILRHQLGCGQPAEPPTWMVAAATEIADGINCPGFHARTNPVQMRRVITAALEATR